MAEVEIDRISALPEETKVSILSRLPITDAIRTSALSHSWHHLWTFLPGFHAYLHFKNKGPGPNLDNVGHILSSLRGPIRHFSLNCFPRKNQRSCLQHFLDLIFQKGGLWNLSLNCSGAMSRVQLLSFHALKDLDLRFVNISLPGDFGGFHQLTSLKLHDVCISQPDFQSLIDGSKKLTSIELSFNRIMLPKDAGFNGQPVSLTFNCPLLKYLSFDFYFDFDCGEEYSVKPKMIYAPCLDSVNVTASTETDSPLEELVWIGSAALKFMADIAHISHLSLNFNLLMCLPQVDVPHTLRAHFQQLKCLKLIGQLCYMDGRMFKVLCCLLRSMPSVENLELQYHEPWGFEKEKRLSECDPVHPNEYKKKEDGYLCLDQTLRTVAISMKNLRGLEDIMWMVHFILLNANVLELVKITYSNDNKVKSRLLENLCVVEKASAKAHVVFVNSSS
ncbi:hypothetical protein LUZ63_000804 [Rhynchospora breviuscula]|uniref:FBD domain-containing protein n=1 Tax=Rhynchospora breviuscula TaxID=2022672 RepID=A0A9Q0HWZ8_9POAL|nr:hypothetical protein LUZ63_000804 [Rhynchospora breviuscula]